MSHSKFICDKAHELLARCRASWIRCGLCNGRRRFGAVTGDVIAAWTLVVSHCLGTEESETSMNTNIMAYVTFYECGVRRAAACPHGKLELVVFCP